MSASKIETEAKFIIPDQPTLLALQSLTQLADFDLKPLGTKTVTDHYLDTTDKLLFQAGYACRLRCSRNKQIITLKSLQGAEGEVHRRQEIETELPAEHPQADHPQAWPDSQAKKLVLEIVGPALWQTLFTVYQTRHQFQVFWQGRPVIELSLDEVSLRNPAMVDYREFEAELLEAGSEADLRRFISEVQAKWLLEVEPLSKYERAWAIAKL